MTRLVLKLGGKCNLNCAHCHSKNVRYEYNPKIINYIQDMGYDTITFSGGEPFLYWPIIENIIKSLGKSINYKIITNGTLLTFEKLQTLVDYNVTVIFSFDGKDGKRDTSILPKYEMLVPLKKSFAITVYKENMNLEKIQKELDELCEYYRIYTKQSLQPNFIHQTEDVYSNTSLEDAKEYCKQLARIIEPELVLLSKADDYKKASENMSTTYMAIKNWYLPKPFKGIKCFNELVHVMSIDGRFLGCPYTDKHFVGDIITGINWKKVENLVPTRCKKCNIYNVCKGACFTNVTMNECYIAKTMNKWLVNVINKYNLQDRIKEIYEDRLLDARECV